MCLRGIDVGLQLFAVASHAPRFKIHVSPPFCFVLQKVTSVDARLCVCVRFCRAVFYSCCHIHIFVEQFFGPRRPSSGSYCAKISSISVTLPPLCCTAETTDGVTASAEDADDKLQDDL